MCGWESAISNASVRAATAFDAKGNDETGAPDLTGRLTRASTDVAIFNIIRDGVPGTAMLPVSAGFA